MKTLKIYTYLFIALAFSWSFVEAQTAANGWTIENIHGPSQVGIVDTIPVNLNKDGLMDVVSVSIDDGDLRAYINQGNSAFEQQYISTEVAGAFRVSATDFNNDGETDFLIPSIETQEIIALIADTNAAEYGYRKQIIAEGVLLPTDAQAADFNDDGLMDVVSISFEEDLVLYHQQRIDGKFDTLVLAEEVIKPMKIELIDGNSDGHLDFLVASTDDNSVRIFENDTQNGFIPNVISNQVNGAWYVTTCDFDKNDDMDFVVSAVDDNRVMLFVNEGASSFVLEEVIYDLQTPRALHCADIDTDGFTEMLAISGAQDAIHMFQLSEGADDIVVTDIRDGYVSVKTADLNNDGESDVLTQAFFEQRNFFYFSDLNQEAVVWQDFPEGIISITVDANQAESFFYAAFRTGELFNYANGLVELLFNGSKGIRALLLADINQDTFLDVFSVNSESGEALTHLNGGADNYVSQVVFDQLMFPASSQKIEVLGEEKILVATTFDESLWVFDGLDFTSIGNMFNGNFSVHVADLNSDQLDDIVIANYIEGNISLATQDLQGQFQVANVSSDKPRVFSVKTIDMDNDSDLDIVSAVNQSNEVWWHENTGIGFTDHLISTDIFNPRDIDVREINGRKYIAVSSFSSDGGGVYLISTTAGDQFTVRKISDNIHGSNTLGFIDQPGGIGLLVGGFNNGSLSKLTQIDLIYKNAFE